MDCSIPGSSVHGILQERILEWVAISLFMGSSQLGDQTHLCLHLLDCRQILHPLNHLESPNYVCMPFKKAYLKTVQDGKYNWIRCTYNSHFQRVITRGLFRNLPYYRNTSIHTVMFWETFQAIKKVGMKSKKEFYHLKLSHCPEPREFSRTFLWGSSPS